MKTKRIISLLASLAMIVTAVTGAMSVSAETDSGSCGDGVIWTWEESTKTLTFSGNGDITNAEEYQKYAETTEHIILESGITKINAITGSIPGQASSYGAFYGFNALKDVQFNNNLTEIGEGSFYECPLEGELNIPDTLTYIGVRAFKGTNISSIKLHEGMTVGGSAFGSCELLKEVTISKNVTFGNTPSTNGNSNKPVTFANCTKLEKVIIEEGVTELGSGMFLDCESLENVYIYSSDISIIPKLWFTETVFPIYPRDGMSQNPVLIDTLTFHIYKDSITEKTMRNAGYLINATEDKEANYVYLPDITALKEILVEAEAIDTGIYTDETVSALTKAIENAKAVLENLDATQDEVDKAVQAINDAKTALAEKPDEPSSSDPSDSSNSTDNSSDPSNSSGNNNQSQSPNTPATPSTSAPTTATPKPTTPPTVTTAAKPAKVKNVKVTAKKKKLNVSWKKVSGATGYEVLSATNNKFTKNKKTVTVKKNKVTLKKLKPKKKYFVKVRAYKLASGRKYFGKWSKVVKKKVR